MAKQTFLMDTNRKEDSAFSPPTTPASTSIFGTSTPSAAAFLVAILLFLLPFAEVRCNDRPLANNTGLGIAMGSEWKELVTRDLFGNSVQTRTADTEEHHQKQNPNLFAIVALSLGIIGVAIAISRVNRGSTITFYIALLAAASLIGMLIDLRSKAKSDTSVKSTDLNVDIGMKITVAGTAWFYFAVILFIVAAFLSLWQKQAKNKLDH